MSNISLIVIGSSDAFSSGGRGNTCFYIRSAAHGILVDCGATTLSGLKKQGLSSDDIDVLILTHFHGDHFAGLPFFILDAARLRRQKKFTIISPPGCRQKLEQAVELFYPGLDKALQSLNMEYIEFSGRDNIIHDNITLESFPVIHTPASLPHGIRLTVNNKIIAYTGDTEWTDTIFDIVSGADLAICECTFFSKQEKNHINYTTLREHLPQFDCHRLLLTHFDEEMLNNMNSIQQACAYDGMVIQL
jgi:ribonuclease BN (tRNA processing enzyme)